MTETPTALGVQTCDACGQSDTDPMIHVAYGGWQKDARIFIAEPSFHHDCLPAEWRAQVAESAAANDPANIATLAIIEAAENGTRGDDLRAVIDTQTAEYQAAAADDTTKEN